MTDSARAPVSAIEAAAAGRQPMGKRREQLALCAILALALALRLWRVEQGGWGAEYYSAAVRSMALNWHNLLFAAFDPAGFISVDKPPVALWLQVASVKLLQARVEILHDIEVRYLPARAKIIPRTETIIKEVPTHVSTAADNRCTVPAGFVRVHDTAFGFDDPAVAGEPDDGPAGIPLSEVAKTLASNAGACLQWREQALSLRLAYESVRMATAK